VRTSILTCSIPDGPLGNARRRASARSPDSRRGLCQALLSSPRSGGSRSSNDIEFFSLLHRYELQQDRGRLVFVTACPVLAPGAPANCYEPRKLHIVDSYSNPRIRILCLFGQFGLTVKAVNCVPNRGLSLADQVPCLDKMTVAMEVLYLSYGIGTLKMLPLASATLLARHTTGMAMTMPPSMVIVMGML
jgi:hypothetical protein